MTFLDFFRKSETRDCETEKEIASEGSRGRIDWSKNSRYDEILKKHYFTLNGKNYVQKVINEIGFTISPPAIYNRVGKLGLFQELQKRKLEDIINKDPLSQKQRDLIKKWRYFTELYYSDRHLYLRAGIYEIRNRTLDIHYVGYTLILFYRLWKGYLNRNDRSEKFDNEDERYIIKMIDEHGIEDFEFRVDFTFHSFDDYENYMFDDGHLNGELLKTDLKNKESKLIHKRLKQGIRLVNQAENPYFIKIVGGN